MAEYIEREAALQICEKEYQERLEMLDYCGDTVAWNIAGAIKGIPAADVAPVVRCKDCKYRADRLYCRLRETPYIVTNVDFCSFGVPRED